MRENHRGLALFCAEMGSATHRGRTPEDAGTWWASPGVRSHGVAARNSEEKARRRRRKRRERELGLQQRRKKKQAHGGGFSRQGGRTNKGYVKLPHCPSLLSFIRPKVVHT